MYSKMVEVVEAVVVLEELVEKADLPKYQDQQSVEDVAKRNSTFSRVNGTDT